MSEVMLLPVKSKILWTIFATILAIVIFANLRNPEKELKYVIDDPAPINSPRFPESIATLLDPHFTKGNRVETLLNGDQIFPAMLKAIREAQKTITFESYIYWSGTIGREFAEALAERARNKVRVHLLLDWAGSQKIAKQDLEIMENAGVEISRYHEPRWYNITRMNNRTHRKILVVDGRIGFTGGVGIADEWSGNGLDPKRWRDTHYRVEGPVVAEMQSAFMDNWLKVRKEVHSGPDYFPAPEPRGKSLAQMFISSASEGGSSVRIMYLMALAGARESLVLESAYFVPDPHSLDQILAARRRGVEVKLIVPGELTDSAIVDYASRDLWGKLLKAGVHIYRYRPALFHCKVLVIDHRFVSVGSTNFDERSFRLNDEANLNVLDEDFARAQLAIIDEDIRRADEYTYADWKARGPWEKIMGEVMSLLNSQL